MCACACVREPDYQLCMFPSRWRCPLGESQFCTHTQLSRDLRVSLQEHMSTFNKLSRPLKIKLSKRTFNMLVKNFNIPIKSQKVMFFSGPDAGSLLSGTVKRSSEARCLAGLKRQNIWSHFSRHYYLQQDVRSYSIARYSIDQIVNPIFQTIIYSKIFSVIHIIVSCFSVR